jgi:hypothetical protein
MAAPVLENYSLFQLQDIGSQLRPGPHMVSEGKLFSIYRVHDDVNGAFMVATQPQLIPGCVNMAETYLQ